MTPNKNNNKDKPHPTLGVVAISYNEQRDLPGFIEHLLPWVDEIIIVDDGSTDQSAEIAETAGPKVKFIISPRSSGEYFSHQRNKGIAASSCDWLLHMDIDERVTPELAEEIKKALGDSGKDAYRYRRLNYFLHRPMRGGGWQDWNLVHLARREVFSFSGMYHEKCLVSTPVERIGQLKAKMWHLNDESYRERMEKSMLYCREQAGVLINKGTRMQWWHLLLLPMLEFTRKLFFKKGYRDGSLGLLFALHSACAMLRSCALVWDQQNMKSRDSLEQQIRKNWLKSSFFKNSRPTRSK